MCPTSKRRYATSRSSTISSRESRHATRGEAMRSRRGLLAAGVASASTALGWGSWRERGNPLRPRWTNGVPLPAPRSEMSAAVLGGRIYVAAGWEDGHRVDMFDPVAQRWKQLPSLPFAIHHAPVAALGDRLIVAGGYTHDSLVAMGHVWGWRPGETDWQMLASLPKPRGAFGMAVVANTLYAIGGANERLSGPVTGETLRYDVMADRWEALAPMPTPREHLAVVAASGRIYAIGGRANNSEGYQFAAKNEVYDPATDGWSAATDLPVPRGGLSGVLAGKQIVVLGGERGTKTYADANRYDPESDLWDALPAMPTARHGLASAYVDGLLYAISGSTLAGTIQTTPVVERLWLGDTGATPIA